MLGWLMELFAEGRPCRRRLNEELAERGKLLEENAKLARRVTAHAIRARRRLDHVSMIVLVQAADEVGEALSDERPEREDRR